MAQLIQMRQQIRAIGTIKKITHAMRLISMSSHSQMGNKSLALQNYKEELLNLLNIVQSTSKNLKSEFISPNNADKRKLIILVGSQKGLAGTFNTSLFKLFDKHVSNEIYNTSDFIAVGKKAVEHIKKHKQPIFEFENLNQQKLSQISESIFQTIINAKPLYTDVVLYGNYPKSFFSQLPKEYVLIPTDTKSESKEVTNTDNYIWEQPITEIFNSLVKEYIHFSIQTVLFNSLLAEHAARFQSMDSATRNAEELLETLKLQYNKIRQAKITKEIAEVSQL